MAVTCGELTPCALHCQDVKDAIGESIVGKEVAGTFLTVLGLGLVAIGVKNDMTF